MYISGIPARPFFLCPMQQRYLLQAGYISSLVYFAINIIVPFRWPEYVVASQTVSELSAIGAPTRSLWILLCAPYTLLTLLFAVGMWRSVGTNRRLRIAGFSLLVYSLLGFLWPLAPMHLRETLAAGGGTWTDRFHIALGAVTEILFLLALITAGTSFGKGFRNYSFLTLAGLLVFGTLTFLQAPLVGKNEPTPLLGIWERINIGLFLGWMMVLTHRLLKAHDQGWVNKP